MFRNRSGLLRGGESEGPLWKFNFGTSKSHQSPQAAQAQAAQVQFHSAHLQEGRNGPRNEWLHHHSCRLRESEDGQQLALVRKQKKKSSGRHELRGVAKERG